MSKNIKNKYETACNEYLKALFVQWQLEDCSYFWVSDYIGGVCCIDEDLFIGIEDIRYCVDNGIDYDTYQNYVEYTTKCHEYGFDTLNLKSFVKGAPRISAESFEKLDSLKKSLEELVEEVKENLKKSENQDI